MAIATDERHTMIAELDPPPADRTTPRRLHRVSWIAWGAFLAITGGVTIYLLAVFTELEAHPGAADSWSSLGYALWFVPAATAWSFAPTTAAIAAQLVRDRGDRRRIEWLSGFLGLATSATIIAVDHVVGPAIGLYSDAARLMSVGAITLCGLPLVYLLLSYPPRRTFDTTGRN